MRTSKPAFAHIFLICSLLLSLLVGTTSYATNRPLPSNAKTGELSLSKNNFFLIDGEARLLTAGAQIRTQQNTLIQPQTLKIKLANRVTDPEVQILYTENNQGQIHRIWILTAKEVRKYPLDAEESVLPVIIPDRAARSYVPHKPLPDRTATPSPSGD